MVDVVGRAKVIIEGDVDSRSIDSAGGKIGKALKTGAIVGVAALGTLAVAGFKSVQAFEDAEAVSRKLGNVLANMGVGEAAEKVEKLADSLQRTTGVDDELIKSGQTILATFSEIAKSAGEVGGTFERATKLSVDLAAAGFGTVESASVQLGKALQDPIKGITALNKSGVTFTETQKQQIKNFVETGDVASAQNLILKEVERQVGGTAEAGAKSSDKIARGLDEVKESVGHLITKLLEGKDGNDDFSDSLFTLADSLNKLADSDAWQDLGKVFGKLGKLIEWVADTTERMTKDFKGMDDLFKKGGDYEKLGKALKKIGDLFAWIADKIRTVKNLLGGGDVNFQGSSAKELTNLVLGGSGTDQFASGGTSSGGWAVVGEQGPELLNLPSGATVYSNAESQRMAAAGGFTYAPVFNGPSTGAGRLQELEWLGKFGSLTGVAAHG